MKNLIIIIIFCSVIIGVPTATWAVGNALHASCCPWQEYLQVTVAVTPVGISIGVIVALVVEAYQRLLRAVEQQH